MVRKGYCTVNVIFCKNYAQDGVYDMMWVFYALRGTQVRLMRDTSTAHEGHKYGSRETQVWLVWKNWGLVATLFSGFFIQQFTRGDVELFSEASCEVFGVVKADFVGNFCYTDVFLSLVLQD